MQRPAPNNPKALKEREALFLRAHESASRSYLATPQRLESAEEYETRLLAQRIWDHGGQRWRRLDLPLAHVAQMLRGRISELHKEPEILARESDPAAAQWNWDLIRATRLHTRLELVVLGYF